MALFYLVWAGLIKPYTLCWGLFRIHTPMCDARAAARKNTARLIHSHYEFCEDAPAAVVSD